MNALTQIRNYYLLTKPEIMLLVLITGATALVVEGSIIHYPVKFLLVMVGLALTGGSANAFNMYLERDIDSQMARTRKRRPLPLGTIRPPDALLFAIILGLFGISIFAIFFNYFSALLALGTIVYYAFFYTLILKPHTVHNILIGGAAGAMGPVIAWVAATGSLQLAPVLLFLIIFIWSPPHFWALALYLKKDYALVKMPMLPVIKGEKASTKQILIYSLMLVASSLLLILIGAGYLYLIVAIIVGLLLVSKAVKLKTQYANDSARAFFGYSIVYLFAIFTALIADTFLKIAL